MSRTFQDIGLFDEVWVSSGHTTDEEAENIIPPAYACMAEA